MSKQFASVIDFNKNLLNVPQRDLGIQDLSEFQLSIAQMKEEIDEYEQAYKDQDFIAQVDALIDLQYFLFGVMYKVGLSPEKYAKVFDVVHEANMLKKAGVNKKRGDFGAVDASKPAAWVDPAVKIGAVLSE
jgi:predicted HAD superfamily Cof-like phosphohydrolase